MNSKRKFETLLYYRGLAVGNVYDRQLLPTKFIIQEPAVAIKKAVI